VWIISLQTYPPDVSPSVLFPPDIPPPELNVRSLNKLLALFYLCIIYMHSVSRCRPGGNCCRPWKTDEENDRAGKMSQSGNVHGVVSLPRSVCYYTCLLAAAAAAAATRAWAQVYTCDFTARVWLHLNYRET